jgi:hypothetical protein
MNKHKLAITAFAVITLIATACKKNDLKHQPAEPKAPETAVATSQWRTVSSWSNSKQDAFTVYSGKIEDNNITSDVVSKGLVLVYKSNGANILTLPAEDKGSNNYWYYQVSKGSVVITSDVYGAGFDQASTFQYFILTKEKVAELEAQGYSKAKLMSLSHAEASQLIAK